MKIDDATAGEIYAAAVSMRQSDYEEFAAVSWAEDRFALATEITQRFQDHPAVLCASVDGSPIAIGAVIEARPNVGTLFFLATDKFSLVAFGLTRFIKGTLFPRLKEAGMHRIECASIEGHEQAHRWIEALGLEREACLPGYGKNKENYIQFAWVSDACKTST
jgi:hypothetical protein